MPHKLAKAEAIKREKRYRAPGSYENTIKIMQRRKHINGIQLIKRVRRGMKRIERQFRHYSPEEVSIVQALFIHRTGSRITDAIIDANYANPQTKKTGIEVFEKLPTKERLKIWDAEFDKVIDNLVRLPEVQKRKRTLKRVDEAADYFRLPNQLINTRRTNWSMIRELENHLITKKTKPIDFFIKELENKVEKNNSRKTPKSKALVVCTAASIYADLMSKGDQTWMSHYIDAMNLAYNRLKKFDAVVNDAILELN